MLSRVAVYVPNEWLMSKPPYSFKRLVNVYKVRLNVYKINDRRIPAVVTLGYLTGCKLHILRCVENSW